MSLGDFHALLRNAESRLLLALHGTVKLFNSKDPAICTHALSHSQIPGSLSLCSEIIDMFTDVGLPPQYLCFSAGPLSNIWHRWCSQPLLRLCKHVTHILTRWSGNLHWIHRLRKSTAVLWPNISAQPLNVGCSPSICFTCNNCIGSSPAITLVWTRNCKPRTGPS